MKTIRELSSELGISKTYLTKIIRKLDLQTELEKVGNKFVIPCEVEKAVKTILNDNEGTNESENKENELTNYLQSEIQFLRDELAVKNEEIRTLHKLLNQQQQLTLKNNNQIEQLKIELEENDVRKLNFWSRIFHKN